MRCFAMVETRVAPGTPGARAVTVVAPSTIYGPTGGYTPAAIAKAYGVNLNLAPHTTVGIVDAYNQPNALADLNQFNDQYDLPHENINGTSTFTVLNQSGQTSPLPGAACCGWDIEIDLDVQAVRGLCHTCKIVLVEANDSGLDNLGKAEDAAIAAGATIVSNSWGGTEYSGDEATLAAHFDHRKTVILVSTGDHGMYDWDTGSMNAPEEPASYNTVIAVGGTKLTLNADGSRKSETVWNGNGPADSNGPGAGASGGGCSTLFAAKGWQSHVNGWNSTACGSNRLSADVSADADPATGFDMVHNGGWMKVGGTSLATPLIAAMWALAGGSGGVAYPSLSLYGHMRSDATHPFHDITMGGNGYCGGLSPTDCNPPPGAAPNTRGNGIVDCAWVGTTATRSAGTRACKAAPGFDGPSGVGTPKGLRGFTPVKPTARIQTPATITHGHAGTYSATGSVDPFPGGTITHYTWKFGDGTTSTQATVSHTYATAGHKTLTLIVGDNYGQFKTLSVGITVN
jgi:subtilase family serine protease